MTQPAREQRVSDAFVALADTLVDDYDIIDLLDQLVAHCVTLPAADAAGILLADPRDETRPVAASSETGPPGQHRTVLNVDQASIRQCSVVSRGWHDCEVK